MKLVELITKTRDCESFEERAVDPELLDALWEAVRLTSSAANTQPWEIYLVRDGRTREKLDGCVLEAMLRSGAGGNPVSRAPLSVVVAFDRKRAAARFGQVGEALFAVQDTSAAVTHLRLAAAGQGLGTRWIREVDLEQVAAALGCPPGIRPVALLTLGYPREAGQEPPLLAVADWLHTLEG